MARPLRFRCAPGGWSEGRVRANLLQPLDANLGATMRDPWYRPPTGYTAKRLEMDNGDIALFCFGDDEAYWVGNTETPRVLWDTEKCTFDEAPFPVARWVQRELLAHLHMESPWLESYPHVSWFFLPVFLSKDGRQTTRQFFREHAAGFPDASPDRALSFYEEFLRTGALDEYRYEMASKLGTSTRTDLVRMSAAMAEFNAAKLLYEAGYELTPEIEVTTGHSLDFRASRNGEGVLVEVTRPRPPGARTANTPVAAIRETAQTKTTGQLAAHGGGAVLFVDCSSFSADGWAAIRDARPDLRHRPAVVFRAHPSTGTEGYSKGSVPLDLPGRLA